MRPGALLRGVMLVARRHVDLRRCASAICCAPLSH
ncbi:putative leader peptide [Kineococcus gynurae]|uniref:Leader peptide n=2 Tax=Kineococcus gynurae TaxID=452979 RepID=A0ABV5LVN8_9ACTN